MAQCKAIHEGDRCMLDRGHKEDHRGLPYPGDRPAKASRWKRGAPRRAHLARVAQLVSLVQWGIHGS